MLIFQYGSNCSERRLNSPQRLAGRARPLGLAVTHAGWELEFSVASRQNGCAAAHLVPGQTRITGVLYQVPGALVHCSTSHDRRSFDAIEGNYRREAIWVRTGTGAPIQAVTYRARSPQPGLTTDATYVGHMLEGLHHFGAPAEYLAYVRERVLLNNPKLKLAGVTPPNRRSAVAQQTW